MPDVEQSGQEFEELPCVVMTLTTDEQWQVLLDILTAESSRDDAAKSIVRQLQSCDVRSAVFERDYLDRDYSAEFSGFYSKLFSRYRRRAQRIHFFRADLDPAATLGALASDINGIAAYAGNGEESSAYVGFIVLRPIKDAPLGRSILSTRMKPDEVDSSIEVRSTYTAHLLGTELRVRSFPFIQQDQRISACAQAVIWSCGRHFENRHRGPWKSIVDITEDASKPTDEVLASSLPAGAGGLGINNMVRALSAMNRYPFLYGKVEGKTDSGNNWGSVDPASIAVRYIRSGIPVILVMAPDGSDDELHAVVAVGHTYDSKISVEPRKRNKEKIELNAEQARHAFPNISEFVTHLVIHDDQSGAYMRMPLRECDRTGGEGEHEFSLDKHALSIVVPLPNKVYAKGEAAEIVAWDRLDQFQDQWDELKAEHATGVEGSSVYGESLHKRILDGDVIAQTYLTFGSKYKMRMQASDAADAVKESAIAAQLPLMVWVTEFGNIEDLAQSDPSSRRIFGHCVVDATATGQTPELLLVHLPGFFWWRVPAKPDFFDRVDERFFGIPDDRKYAARFRT